ncbi:MAG: hypothetical protein EPN85_11065 [Bacteroidetes bacterium]|nr:MAG: hypothetical protein EPN85_11065 [Bacteroidota bacterium]
METKKIIYCISIITGFCTVSAQSQSIVPVKEINVDAYSTIGEVTCMVSDTIKNILYVAFRDMKGKNVMKIASWNGKKWSELGSGFRRSENDSVVINTMIIYKDELYVGGNFYTANGYSSQCMAKWNGKEWIPVGGNATLSGEVNALAVYKNELYAGGKFRVVFEERNVPQWIPVNIAKWNGIKWINIGGVGMNGNDQIYTLAVYNEVLYVGGEFMGKGFKNLAMLSVKLPEKKLNIK